MSTIPTVSALAAEFSTILHDWLGAVKMRTVAARNRTPAYTRCCASHDFCDANMAMLEAYSNLSGIADNDIDLQDDATLDAINAAWDLAKRNGFKGA